MDEWKKSPKSAQQKRSHFHRSGGTKNASSSSKRSFLVDLLLVDTSEILLEDERGILPGVPIRASTIPALVRLCIQAFDKNGRVYEEFLSFPRILFLMHQWFISSRELADLFIEHYDSASNIVSAGSSTPCCSGSSSSTSTTSISSSFHKRPPHFSRSAVEDSLYPPSPCESRRFGGGGRSAAGICRCEMFKTNIAHALRYWIQNFPLHFYMDQRLNEIIQEFGTRLMREGAGNLAQIFSINSSTIPNFDWIRNVSRREDAQRRKEGRKVSLIFNHLNDEEISLHLTFLEHKIIRRISFEDFKKYAQQASLEDNPSLERSVALFNGLSQWIQCVVLSRPTPSQRADVIVKFVRVAKNLRNLQNFNSLMAVVGSLSHSALARLQKTMDCVPESERKTLAELTKLVSSASNFSLYRKALQESKGFKIPILGVHLKDLISLNTALPDTVENGKLVNFRKISQLSIIFSILQDMQQSSPPAQANNDLLNTLRISLDMNYSEDEIYELSLSREPKSTMSSPGLEEGSGGTKGGVGCYEKQVQILVDAVFRNFDANHDGFISRDEFQAILQNFPSIDNFVVLDENRDGRISKSEMEKYLKKNAGSRHNWQETTYFKPTFCSHCSGLLWGLVKQGVKCQACSLNCHKTCKDYMLHECKGQFLFLSSSPEPNVKRRGFRRRKNHSSGSQSGSPPGFFNSLEQLSLSIESNDSGSGLIGGRYGSSSPSSSSYLGSKSSRSDYTSGQNTLFSMSTPKSPSTNRKFSVLGSSNSSHSVPSSPKLGFSSFSFGKNLVHSFTTTHGQHHSTSTSSMTQSGSHLSCSSIVTPSSPSCPSSFTNTAGSTSPIPSVTTVTSSVSPEQTPPMVRVDPNSLSVHTNKESRGVR